MIIDLFVRHRKVGLDRFLIENYTCDKIILKFQTELCGPTGAWIPDQSHSVLS